VVCFQVCLLQAGRMQLPWPLVTLEGTLGSVSCVTPIDQPNPCLTLHAIVNLLIVHLYLDAFEQNVHDRTQVVQVRVQD
jgi:hypothetical protein